MFLSMEISICGTRINGIFKKNKVFMSQIEASVGLTITSGI